MTYTLLFLHGHVTGEVRARPNLSAFSITITLAFGTFTPTSITVVEIRISIFPFLNSSIIVSFSLGLILPCKYSTLYSGNISCLYLFANSITDYKFNSSFSSTNGQTI